MKHLATLGSITLALMLCTAFFSSAQRARVPGEEQDRILRTGTIASWQLVEDGTIYVLVRSKVGGDQEAEEFASVDGGYGTTWYRSPPRQTVQNDFEEMFLDIVLAARAGTEGLTTMTFAAEEGTARSGRTIEDALYLVSVGQP